jgi:hypothetical protein
MSSSRGGTRSVGIITQLNFILRSGVKAENHITYMAETMYLTGAHALRS